MVAEETLRLALGRTLDHTSFPWLGARYEGKVRDCYTTGDGRRYLVVTDRVSAFDRVLGTLPLKGQILNGLAAFWFEQTRDVAPSHLLSRPDPSVMEALECAPLPVEMVVRAYLTGVTSTSIWTHYAAGARVFCGHRLPEGLRKNEPLPAPIVTPSTKAAKGGHDVSVSREELLAETTLSASDFDEAAAMALALFEAGSRWCAARGLILADTKYEIGRDAAGRLRVIDEIHTPDSSRFWFLESYEGRLSRGEEPESFDKEYVRRWLAAQGFKGDGPIPVIPDEIRVEASRRYIEAYERITGADFVPDLEDPVARITRALGGEPQTQT
ncbi:phosphoribosylaminoimidazolesuccinocarboxamide synthase [Chondromyces apiculatus]|uniref:Phosphoribosylaminoimidazole-succinocarboxamide synthase n=1 Tax=Chondromyces apiculatus DSM 436 TaxID=1192034 RepID=A0A017T847_9BACT|nr:phosphoribosylaminoimidazolesuccinocarboxamide synthase [Chondromyces apiculatus]EYF04975.1 Phosphoribosylaminoimidazole-succinocarboxamide synthase [Chondromyces apiculatus DSM 436]